VQGISNKDFIHSPFLDSVNKILPQMQDEISVPALVNLEMNRPAAVNTISCASKQQ
jgi:hypothetical protein